MYIHACIKFMFVTAVRKPTLLQGPASVTLYPGLIGKIRIMIYNGDADNCVPYQGNAEWVDRLESTGLYSEKNAWRPWYAANMTWMPAGYVTEYVVKDSDLDFSFATVRLAGTSLYNNGNTTTHTLTQQHASGAACAELMVGDSGATFLLVLCLSGDACFSARHCAHRVHMRTFISLLLLQGIWFPLSNPTQH